jgi:hypothetical protein
MLRKELPDPADLDSRTGGKIMTRTRYGMLAGIAGAAFAAWWWRHRGGSMAQDVHSERGEVIYSNTPRVSEID